MIDRLTFIYGPEKAPAILADIEALLARYAGRMPAVRSGWDQTDALLIAYGDSILKSGEPPLRTLGAFLRQRLGKLVSFVHLLPFFPYSSDDGFAVIDFRKVNGELGDWPDVRALAADYRLVFDGVVNHVSASSAYVKGCCAGDPAFEDFVIALPPDTDTSSVLRTRNLPLLHEFPTARGSKWLWTTFGPDQVDLNFANPRVLIEMLDVLLFYAANGASVVRLDAIPYLWKELGTSCAHLPRTHELIKLIRDVYDAAAPAVLLLTETNVPHHQNVSYFGDRGDEAQIIYNFSLPPLILFSLLHGDARRLTAWARTIERIGGRATYLNITATHDGIGMRPTEGLLSEAERKGLMDLAFAHHGDVTGKRNSDGTISPYELNLNYFDAINDPDAREPIELAIRRFMLSQAIPLALLGIPGIYIHSLLGSRNDLEGVKRTGRARRINRQRLELGALEAELADRGSLRARVLAEYKRLLMLRARQKAFGPDAAQDVLDFGPPVFAVRRTDPAAGQAVVALHNVTPDRLVLDSAEALGRVFYHDLLNEEEVLGDRVELDAYQVRWLSTEA